MHWADRYAGESTLERGRNHDTGRAPSRDLRADRRRAKRHRRESADETLDRSEAGRRQHGCQRIAFRSPRTTSCVERGGDALGGLAEINGSQCHASKRITSAGMRIGNRTVERLHHGSAWVRPVFVHSTPLPQSPWHASWQP